MDNSAYVTLSKQMALFQDMDVTANNIANSNTNGYNAGHMMFSSYLTNDINQGNTNPMSMANATTEYRTTTEGSLSQTGNPLDLAIQGKGYFTIDTPLGQRYTRAGNFTVAPDGTITTQEGYPVLDTSGQHIELPESVTSIAVGSIGNIKVNGDDFATIGVAQFANEQLLDRVGSTMYKSSVAPQGAGEDVRVIQGTLEGSNVQPVLELTHMMQVSRAVTDTAQFVSMIYDLESKASTAWAQQS